jgi:hypothetical protein
MSWSWSRRLSETVQSQEVKVRSQKEEVFCQKCSITYLQEKEKDRKRILNKPTQIFDLRWQ